VKTHSNGGQDMKLSSQTFFLAHQVFGIVGFQIEIERIFNIVGVIISFHQSKLGSENLQCLKVIAKNWPNNACEGCEGGQKFSLFFTHEENIIDDNKTIIEEEGYFEDA
jgi:hypothetical protein